MPTASRGRPRKREADKVVKQGISMRPDVAELLDQLADYFTRKLGRRVSRGEVIAMGAFRIKEEESL